MAAKRRKQSEGDRSKAIAYLRVSTDEQHLGPEAQREQIERYCEREGVEIVATFSDHGVSGAAPVDKRPALLAAVSAIEEHGAGLLLVAKRDRLARDIEAAAIITRLTERAGGVIRSADGVGNADTAEGMLLRGMVDLFAQYERALIAARTKAALGVKRARGELVGSVPYGFALAPDGVKLAPDPEERRTVARVVELREGGATLRGIARTLDAEGFAPRGGSRWHPQSVSNILRAEQEREEARQITRTAA